MPYRSLAQERWAHTPAGTKALGGHAKVSEWDQATRGTRLPDRVKKHKADPKREHWELAMGRYHVPKVENIKHKKEGKLKNPRKPQGKIHQPAHYGNLDKR